MAEYTSSNHDLTHGEMADIFKARADLVMYAKCADTLQNVMILPSGAATSRFGTVYNSELTDATHFQMFSWTTVLYNYLVIINDNDEIIINNLTSDTTSTIAHTFSSAVTARLVRSSQQQNQLIFTSGTDPMFVLTSNQSNGTVTSANFVFKNPPAMIYDTGFINSVFELSAVTVTDPSTATSSLPTLTITTMGDFGGFSEDFVGGQFYAAGKTSNDLDGQATIEDYISNTQVRVRISTEFAPFGAGPTGKYYGKDSRVTISESAYNDTRGWPAAISSYGNRLIIGGGKSIPQTWFASAVGTFNDFNVGYSNDGDAISFTLGTNKSCLIQNIVSATSVQIFTQSNEQATPLWSSSALTPSNVEMKVQTSYGSENVIPVQIDNQTIFIKRGGRAIMAFGHDDSSYTYSSTNISVLSSHLINDPIDMAAYLVNDRYDANFLFLINSDGSMAIYETLQEENVSAWCSTQTYTGDQWLNVMSVEDRVFFIVKRNGKYLLEELNWDIVLDCSTLKSSLSAGDQTISLGDIYADRDISIITDVTINGAYRTASYIDTVTADENGDIEYNIPSDGDYWFGLSFEQKIVTLNAHVNTPEGDTLQKKKSITWLYVQYYLSYSFKVNGREVPMTSFYSEALGTGVILDTPLQPQTGIYDADMSDQAWERETFITCTQDLPLPMTILGISYDVTI